MGQEHYDNTWSTPTPPIHAPAAWGASLQGVLGSGVCQIPALDKRGHRKILLQQKMSDGAMLVREGYGHMRLATCPFLSKLGDRYRDSPQDPLYSSMSSVPITPPYVKVTGCESL